MQIFLLLPQNVVINKNLQSVWNLAKAKGKAEKNAQSYKIVIHILTYKTVLNGEQ